MKKFLVFALLLATCHLSLATAFAQGPRTPVVDAKFLLSPPSALTATGMFWPSSQSTQNYDSGTIFWTMTSAAAAPPTTCSIALLAEPATGSAKMPINDNNGTQSCLAGGGTAIAIAAGGATTYLTGDVITVTQAGASGLQLAVTAAAGVVTAVQIITPGTGYTPATALATTGGGGTGCTITITGVSGQATVGNLPMYLNASLNLAGGTTPSVTLWIVLSNWQVANLQSIDAGGTAKVNAAVSSATLLKDLASPGPTKPIFLKGIILEKMTATTGSVTVRYGTGVNCAVGTTTLFFLGPQTATSLVPVGYYPVNALVPAGNDLCEIDDAITTSTVSITQ